MVTKKTQGFSSIIFALGRKFSAFVLRVALSGLRQFWGTESPLKMMKNVFYFASKALLVLKIFKFLS